MYRDKLVSFGCNIGLDGKNWKYSTKLGFLKNLCVRRVLLNCPLNSWILGLLRKRPRKHQNRYNLMEDVGCQAWFFWLPGTTSVQPVPMLLWHTRSLTEERAVEYHRAAARPMAQGDFQELSRANPTPPASHPARACIEGYLGINHFCGVVRQT